MKNNPPPPPQAVATTDEPLNPLPTKAHRWTGIPQTSEEEISSAKDCYAPKIPTPQF